MPLVWENLWTEECFIIGMAFFNWFFTWLFLSRDFIIMVFFFFYVAMSLFNCRENESVELLFLLLIFFSVVYKYL